MVYEINFSRGAKIMGEDFGIIFFMGFDESYRWK